MNTIKITAGEMMGMNNDLYQICKRLIKILCKQSDSYTPVDLKKELYFSLCDYFNEWYDKTHNKPFISTAIINLLIHRVLRRDFDTLVDVSAYIRLLADELKHLLKQLKGYKSTDIISHYQLTTLDNNLQTLTELDIDLSCLYV